MNWEEFALKIIPILQQVLTLLDHTTPEGRAILAESRGYLHDRLSEMYEDLPKPAPTKAEAAAAKADARAAAKEA